MLACRQDHQVAQGTDKVESSGTASGSGEAETLLSVLGDLFVQISTYKKKFGVIHPKKFMAKVKKENS